MEWFWLVATFASTWFGYARGKRHERQHSEVEAAKEPKPICGCKHHFSKHNEDGTCASRWSEQVLVERGEPRTVRTGHQGLTHKVVYDHERWETVHYVCTCKRYTGPEPLPRYVS